MLSLYKQIDATYVPGGSSNKQTLCVPRSKIDNDQRLKLLPGESRNQVQKRVSLLATYVFSPGSTCTRVCCTGKLILGRPVALKTCSCDRPGHCSCLSVSSARETKGSLGHLRTEHLTVLHSSLSKCAAPVPKSLRPHPRNQNRRDHTGGGFLCFGFAPYIMCLSLIHI